MRIEKAGKGEELWADHVLSTSFSNQFCGKPLEDIKTKRSYLTMISIIIVLIRKLWTWKTSCIGSHINRPSCKSFLPLLNLLLFTVYYADHSKAYRMTCPKFSGATTATFVLIALWLVAALLMTLNGFLCLEQTRDVCINL